LVELVDKNIGEYARIPMLTGCALFPVLSGLEPLRIELNHTTVMAGFNPAIHPTHVHASE